MRQDISDILYDVGIELEEAIARYPSMFTRHDAYAIILEELDEVWDEIKSKDSDFDQKRLRIELTQVAAMCVRAILDLRL